MRPEYKLLDVNSLFRPQLQPKRKKKPLNARDLISAVHTILNDLLPDKKYYRFNPYLTEMLSMSETRPEKIAQLEQDAIMYMRKNDERFQEAAKALMQKRTPLQKLNDYVEFKKTLYNV